VNDADLRALAARRHEAIRRELEAKGVEAARIHAEEPRAHSDEHGAVMAALSVAPAVKGAAAPASQPALR
jgi:hypothetical protein